MARNTPVRLPPLPALRAFEAVARAKSVRDAARDLGLTSSAVSHQLRNLEDHLGVALFNRGNQSIELTTAGEELAGYVERAFGELRQGVASLKNNPDRGILRVSVAPLFAMEILLPALPDFERACPDVQLRLDVGESLADLDSEPIDAAIRIGDEPSASYFFETLLDVWWTPICAPRLLTGQRAIREPEDLQHQVLIAAQDDQIWRKWFAEAGIPDLQPERVLRFDTFLGAVQAAENGLGVVVAPLSMVTRRIQEGRLVAPLDVQLPSPWVYRFVCRRGRERQPKIDRFRRWLSGVCAAHAVNFPQPRAGTATPARSVPELVD